MTCGHSGDMLDQIQMMKSRYNETCDVCEHSKPYGKYQRWCKKRKHSVSLKGQCDEFIQSSTPTAKKETDKQ